MMLYNSPNMSQQKIFVVIFLLCLAGVLVFGVFSNMGNSQKSSDNSAVNDLLGDTEQSTASSLSQPGATAVPQPKQYTKYPGDLPPEKLKNKRVLISTKKGEIEFEIYPEATKAASNFIFLTEDGFYNGLKFHRVEPGFVIQGGDPMGTGSGGPGYQFADEKVTRKYDKGIVAMANAGPNTNGSQFFIMLENHPELPPNYTIFGKVIRGMDVVSKIVPGDLMDKVSLTSN